MSLTQTLQIPFPEFYLSAIEETRKDKKNILSDCFFEKNLCIPQKNTIFAVKTCMLREILQNTSYFIASIPKECRREYGQFFTAEKSARSEERRVGKECYS